MVIWEKAGRILEKAAQRMPSVCFCARPGAFRSLDTSLALLSCLAPLLCAPVDREDFGFWGSERLLMQVR